MARALPLFPLVLALALSPLAATAQMQMTAATPAPPPDRSSQPQQSEGTKKMVEYLKTIAETFNVPENIMANTKRVETFSKQPNMNTAKKIELYQEMIFAGMTEQAIAGRYGIRSIPTLILIARGREVARQSGAMPANAIVGWARQALAAA